jgi:hypothetical protein
MSAHCHAGSVALARRRMPGPYAAASSRTLEAGRELRDPDPPIHRQVGGESVVAATQVLHERVPAHDCSS